MKIDKHNYEAYFLDYHEGNLSAKEQQELMAFLAGHPELQEEFDDYVSEVFIPDTNSSMPGAEKLKKHMMDYSPLEQRMIALVEGDLGHEQREELELEISSSEELKALHAQFRQAKLTPDTGLQYLGAADLKRSLPLLGWTARRVIAAAAAVVILIGIASVLVFQTSGPVVRENFALNQAIQIKPDHILTAHEMPSLRPREIPPASDQPSERESLMIAKAAPVTGTKITDPVTLNHTPVILYARIPESNPYYPALNDAAPALANENKTLAGKVISGFFSKISAPFATDREKTADQNRKVTFWDLAELGVKSINVLGDHDYTLVREYNEKGNVKGVMLVEE